MKPPEISAALPEHLPAVLQLLEDAQLPTSGVADHFHNFFVALRRHSVVGSIGFEQYGDVALIRSAAVVPVEQKSGIGGMLLKASMKSAADLGVRQLVLLTTTAELYFSKKGFVRIDRREITGPITASAEFTGACPASAVCMTMKLQQPELRTAENSGVQVRRVLS